MKEICDHIDDYIQENISTDMVNFHWWGFCEQAIKDNQTHPVTIPDHKQVSFENNSNGLVYHRFMGSSSDEPEDQQWGTLAYKVYKSKMRTILGYRVPDYDESFVFDFINAMPQTLKITGYKQIDASENVSVSSTQNQKTIYNEEFGGGKNETNYEKHILNFNIFAIEYDIIFIKC